MKKFEKIISETLARNNLELNESLQKFLISQNNIQCTFESQVPTCLVLTSSESASSIETQFHTLCNEMEQKIKAKTVVLDEKRCGSIKSTIDDLQAKLEYQFGVVKEKRRNVVISNRRRADYDENSSGGDVINLVIEEEKDSDSEDDIDNSDADE